MRKAAALLLTGISLGFVLHTTALAGFGTCEDRCFLELNGCTSGPFVCFDQYEMCMMDCGTYYP